MGRKGYRVALIVPGSSRRMMIGLRFNEGFYFGSPMIRFRFLWLPFVWLRRNHTWRFRHIALGGSRDHNVPILGRWFIFRMSLGVGGWGGVVWGVFSVTKDMSKKDTESR